VAGTSRRDRARRATLAEIREAVRRLLVAQGSTAVTINAVARELGMSGPALYHYFAGRDELVGAVTADFFAELTAAMEAARDACADDPPGRRLLAAARAMRRWAIAHPAEFQWIFASPLAEPGKEPPSRRVAAGRRFERVFLDLTVELWKARRFPVPDPADLAPSLLEQLRRYCTAIDEVLPPEAAHVMLTCWTRLYGLLCMEVLHQLDFAYSDMEPVFEECLREISARLGVDYSPPEPVRRRPPAPASDQDV